METIHRKLSAAKYEKTESFVLLTRCKIQYVRIIHLCRLDTNLMSLARVDYIFNKNIAEYCAIHFSINSATYSLFWSMKIIDLIPGSVSITEPQ